MYKKAFGLHPPQSTYVVEVISRPKMGQRKANSQSAQASPNQERPSSAVGWKRQCVWETDACPSLCGVLEGTPQSWVIWQQRNGFLCVCVYFPQGTLFCMGSKFETYKKEPTHVTLKKTHEPLAPPIAPLLALNMGTSGWRTASCTALSCPPPWGRRTWQLRPQILLVDEN